MSCGRAETQEYEVFDDRVHRMPKFYGSVTVGERGQVAIPAEARRDQEIASACKLLAFASPDGKALIFVKAEYITEVIASASTLFSQVAQALESNPEESPNEKT